MAHIPYTSGPSSEDTLIDGGKLVGGWHTLSTYAGTIADDPRFQGIYPPSRLSLVGGPPGSPILLNTTVVGLGLLRRGRGKDATASR